jgi:hypothetical protein
VGLHRCSRFEFVGIVVTVDALIDSRQGMFWMPERWAKWRGPAFIIGGIILGGLGNIQSAQMQVVPSEVAGRVVQCSHLGQC